MLVIPLAALCPSSAQEEISLQVGPKPAIPTENPAPNKLKTGFLGVHPINIPDAVRHQLPADCKGGLMTSNILPNSPAVAAGLVKFDIILRVKDQLVFTPEQFAELIRMHQPGETISMEVMRGTKCFTLRATLAEALSDPSEPAIPKASAQSQDRAARDLLDFVRKNPLIGHSYPELTEQLLHDLGLTSGPQEAATKILGKAVDKEGKVEWRREAGKVFVKLEDSTGLLLFDGPCGTPEAIAKQPANIRERLERIQKNLDSASVPQATP
jgi:hypothetical protein